MELIKKQITNYTWKVKNAMQFTLDDTINVPENLLDIERLVLVKGNVVIEDISPMVDRFQVKGNLHYQILYLADKERSSNMTAKLCRMLDLDGVIVTQEGFGNPDTDLIMNCKKIEAEGVKTVIVTDEYAGRDGKSQSLADADAAADAVVTGGNANEVVILPKLDKVIGMMDYVNKIAGASEDTLREDGTLEVELQVITGATNEMGFGTLSAR